MACDVLEVPYRVRYQKTKPNCIEFIFSYKWAGNTSVYSMKSMFWTNEKLSLMIARSSSVSISCFKVQISIVHLVCFFDSGKSLVSGANLLCPWCKRKQSWNAAPVPGHNVQRFIKIILHPLIFLAIPELPGKCLIKLKGKYLIKMPATLIKSSRGQYFEQVSSHWPSLCKMLKL